ncbi:MAG: class I SAM-dependent methyltransferase [Candidatus Diapherotrites archaeon]|nr:class I SAM-dependent methyltransferase [Candidatus Diapherotrites archaeon]
MKNSTLYSEFASVCAKFYDLSIDPKKVADFVDSKVKKFKPKKVLFVGGFFAVAKELIKMGYDLTVVDYTDEMVKEAETRLTKTRVFKADLRDLPFENEFDLVLVIGRVFTHMYSDYDLARAFQSVSKALKPSGLLLFDNYESLKIQNTKYFNGEIKVKGKNIEITRKSSTKLLSKQPFIVNWKQIYAVEENGKVSKFKDELKHRAFSRREIKNYLEKNGFEQIDSGDNFDETSFYSIAKKQ